MRTNRKREIVDYDNSIKKSNELSMAKLNHGLTSNQMQLLAFAIFSTQQDGKTEFRKHDFEKKFNLKRYRTDEAYADAGKIMDVKFSTEDLENERFKFWNVFSSMEYDNGRFEFEWNPKMIPHILELKEKYVLTDLSITARFKSSFSWTLYEFLKAHYGYWYIRLSKEALMRLFGVEDRKTYIKSTAGFKRTVLNVAIEEINEHTEMQVWYKEIKEGRAIVGFEIHWSSGDTRIAATEKQLERLKAIYDLIEENALKYLQSGSEEVAVVTMLGKITMKNRTWDMTVAKMSKEDADEAIDNAMRTLKRLEHICEIDKYNRERSAESNDRADIYYNWLEE